ncbi:MAG TPA: hypothetical protein VGF45_04395 [Polyangia bacterium]
MKASWLAIGSVAAVVLVMGACSDDKQTPLDGGLTSDAREGGLATDAPPSTDALFPTEAGPPDADVDAPDGSLGPAEPDASPADVGAGSDGPAAGDASGADGPLPPGLAVKLPLPPGATILGGHTTACSYGPATDASGERWCAFAVPGPRLGSFELWAVNVTKPPTACNGVVPGCLKLSDRLFSATPQAGPRFPSAHRFFGDTLIFHANEVSTPNEVFVGPIYGWQPGWALPKKISSGDSAFRCVGHETAPAVICLENLSVTDPLVFDLTGGNIAGNERAKPVAQILPGHPVETQSSAWAATFTRDAKFLVYSTGPVAAPPGGQETLFLIETDKIGTLLPQQIGQPGIAEWAISPDETKVFYLRNYNYSPTNPSGTLGMMDFPTGANPVTLSSTRIRSGSITGVAAFNLVAPQDQPSKLGFVSIVQNYNINSSEVGDYLIVKNPAGNLDDATNVLSVLQVSAFPLNSPDLRHARYYLNRSGTAAGVTDARIVRNDPPHATCVLNGTVTTTVFGEPFIGNTGLTLWGQDYKADFDTADGWVASADDCTTKKRKFATNIDRWFVRGSDQVVYADDATFESATLRVAKVSGGDLGPPVTIRAGVDRAQWALLARQEGVIFRSTGFADSNSVYVYPLK